LSAPRPRRLHLHLIEAPLRMPLKMGAKVRPTTRNVLVGLESDGDVEGWGEGLPRDYVTDEKAEDVFDAVQSAASTIAWPDLGARESLIEGLEHLADTLLPDHPSGRCAVEVALLDLGARALGVSAQEIIGTLARRLDIPPRVEGAPLIHSGVIGSGTRGEMARKAFKMRLYGLREIKVKVGPDYNAEFKRLRKLRRLLGSQADLRLDANGVWKVTDAADIINMFSVFNVSSVEQPLARGEEGHLSRVRRSARIPIALDESLISVEDARHAIEGGWCDLFNIRLSKCGGVVSSLRILAEARRAGLGAWLGCMVGESGFLSAAGRAFALAVDGLRHLEGSYDKHLFNEFLTTAPVTFGRRGIGEPLDGPGLGVKINRDTLGRWSQRHEVIELP